MRMILPALLLAGCAGQQVPIPSFPDTGVEFGGPSVSIGRPTMVSCPHTRPDGSYATFETTAELCNELLLSNGEAQVTPALNAVPSAPDSSPSTSPPVGNALSDGDSGTPEPDRVAEPEFENPLTLGGVCSLGKDRVVDSGYCDDLLQAQARVQGVLGPHWVRLSGNRQNLFAIWCFWADECLWDSRMGERIDNGQWLELAGLLMAMLPLDVPQDGKDALGVAMMRDSEIPFPINPM